jgi:hypothetical protein
MATAAPTRQFAGLSRPVRVLWAPHRGMQTAAVNAREDEIFVGGAKGPGKTDVGIVRIARQTDKPLYKGYVTRETGPQLDEIKARMHRLYPRMGTAATRPAWLGDGHGRWTWPSGARVILEAIGTPEEAARVQGKEPSAVFMDEVANVPDERTIDIVQAEIRSPDPTIYCWWAGSGNPGKAGHAWIKRRFVIPCGVDGKRIVMRRVQTVAGEQVLTRRFIPGTVLDNPIYANDPRYMAQLALLPEVLRQQLLYGDWNAGVGTALTELDASVHVARAFTVPGHWQMFGSFDYGFAHNWVWIVFAVDEDGRVWVVDTVYGRRHQLHEIVERVSALPIHDPRYRYTRSDTYVFQSRKERNIEEPTIAELLATHHNIVLSLGITDRKAGLRNLRYYLAWRGIGPDGTDGVPALRFMDTPGNRWLFEQLEAMVTDESDMEDVLKVDSNPETGEGGDDGYDALRVGMASRPPRAIGAFWQGTVRAFSKETLAHMVEVLYRDVPDVAAERRPYDPSTYLAGV